MVDIRVDKIIASGCAKISKEDLEFLYFEREMSKNRIAQLFDVSYNQVSYKLKKFDLNWQRKNIAESVKEVLKDIKRQSLQELIFASDSLNEDNEDGELDWGPIKVLQGKHKGRIGCLDDEEGAYGYVYWGDMVSVLDSCDKIKLKYLTNNITTYDLVKRAEELGTQISRMRALSQFGYDDEVYKKITDLYGEYTYVIGLLNQIYEETVYQDNGNKNRVFLSYSSLDRNWATWIATDLKRAGHQVWFDNWEIEGGHNIIDEDRQGD